jgi:hypothetical protein
MHPSAFALPNSALQWQPQRETRGSREKMDDKSTLGPTLAHVVIVAFKGFEVYVESIPDRTSDAALKGAMVTNGFSTT